MKRSIGSAPRKNHHLSWVGKSVMKQNPAVDIDSDGSGQGPVGARLALRIEAETDPSETLLRCPVDGKRLPVNELRCIGTMVVYCRHCGKGVRISIDTVD